MPFPLLELGGQSERLALLLPANGFPPETYLPALAPLFPRWRVVCLPPRALWEDAGPAPEAPGSWETLAEDLLEGIRRHGLPPALAIGHSFGAVAALLAAVREPARFLGLALLDPTIFPPARLAEFRELRERGATRSRPLVQGALTRRESFRDAAEAFAYWRTRPLFADWSDAMLQRYSAAMLRPVPGGFTLRWPRAWEAHYYESISTEIWDSVARLNPGLPVLVVRGEHSDTFSAEAGAHFAQLVPWAVPRTVAAGHLFPQVAPDATGRILLEWLAGLESPR